MAVQILGRTLISVGQDWPEASGARGGDYIRFGSIVVEHSIRIPEVQLYSAVDDGDGVEVPLDAAVVRVEEQGIRGERLELARELVLKGLCPFREPKANDKGPRIVAVY